VEKRNACYLTVSLDIGRVVRDGFGDAEIDEFEGVSDQNKVGWLEVGVNDPFLMNDIHGF
jgi:hypothetical protein